MYGKFNQSNQKYLEIKLITSIEEYEENGTVATLRKSRLPRKQLFNISTEEIR